MRGTKLLGLVVAVVLMAGLWPAGAVAAQGSGTQTIPLAGATLVAKVAPTARLAAAYESAVMREFGDLVAEYLPVRLVDLTTGTVTPLSGPEDYVLDVAFTPDGAWLAGCYGGGMIMLWDTATASLIKSIPALPNLQRCAFLPDGRTLVVAYPVGALSAFLLWDVENGGITSVESFRFDTFSAFREVSSGPQNFGPYALAAFAVAPVGKRIVSSSINDSLWLWDLDTEQVAPLLVSEEQMPMLSIRDIQFAAEGSTVLYLHRREPAIHIWTLDPAAESAVLPLEGTPTAFALAPDGDLLVVMFRGSPALSLYRLSQPEAAPVEVPLPEGVEFNLPTLAFSTVRQVLVTGQQTEETGENALYLIDLPK